MNVASRLQTLAEPGGVCISDTVHQSLAEPVRAPFRDLGRQRVRNITRPIRVWQWTRDGAADEPELAEAALQQRVQFATARDGAQIAWAAIGSGPPVLKAPNWLNHIEYEWRNPVWGPALAALARRFRLVRFDQRGNGLSDWEVDEISQDAMIGDMATVAGAAGLERFALLGISQGCAFSVRYAVENPEQVSCLVLLGGFLRGRLKRPDPEQKKLCEALTLIIRDGWGSPNPVFRHFFTSNFMPDAPPEIAATFDELQRIATSPTSALRIWEMNNQSGGDRAGAEAARPDPGAALRGRPRGAARGGSPDGPDHSRRALRRAAGQQPRARGRDARLRPVRRGGHGVHRGQWRLRLAGQPALLHRRHEAVLADGDAGRGDDTVRALRGAEKDVVAGLEQ